MDSPCIKQTVCKVFKIFQCGKYLVAYVLKHSGNTKFVNSGLSPSDVIVLDHLDASCEFHHSDWLVDKTIKVRRDI